MIGLSSVGNRTMAGMKSVKFEINGRRPAVMEVAFSRDPSTIPNAHGFALTTNINGTETKFDGSIELRDAAGNVTYTITFQNATCKKYQVTVGIRRLESWVITTPKFDVSAGGTPISFNSHVHGRQMLVQS